MPRPELEPAQVEDLIAFLYSPADTTSAASSDPHGDSSRHSSAHSSNEPWTPSSDLNISSERLKRTDQEPHNWLTYWGDLGGMHYSRLLLIRLFQQTPRCWGGGHRVLSRSRARRMWA